MMMRLIIILAILTTVYLLLRWFLSNPPAAVAKRLRGVLIFTGIVLLLMLAVTGRLHWLFVLIGSLAAVLMRMAPLLLRYAPFLAKLRQPKAGPAGGSPPRSTVNAKFVVMWLDHASGEMGGEILSGTHAGRKLLDLDLGQLTQLLQEYAETDADSAALIEAYLDRRFAGQWREAGAQKTRSKYASGGSGPMSMQEARAVLGVGSAASQEEITKAHRSLIQKLHPDRGGSSYLAAKINQAKDVLLKA